MATILLSLPTWEAPFKAPADSASKLPPPTTKSFEACGEWIENSLLAAGLAKRKLAGSQKKSGKPDGSPTTKSAPRRESKRTGGVKLSEEEFAEDWYDVLKLDEQEGASEDAIRTAYRRRCLETHPDKQPNNSDVEFKKVQRAFEILSDPDVRRAYDSSRTFDDSIPGEVVTEKNFYKSFGPVFDRNKKWSVDDGLPSIGDENTPLSEVKKFYDTWYRYRSWRDFSHEVELEEIDEGMMREEKRYYMRENQRLLDKCMKEEIKRIRTLVDRAYHNDPRLRKQREEEEAQIAAEKAARQAERDRLQAEEERRRQEQSDKERRAQEEKIAAKKAEKENIKSAKEEIEAFFREHDLIDGIPSNKILPDKVRVPNITWIASKSDSTALNALLQQIKSKSTAAGSGPEDGVEAVHAFNEAIEAKEQETGISRYGEPIKKMPTEKKAEAKAAPPPVATGKAKWDEDDLILLQKAIAKFPGGTVERWRRIGTMLVPNKFTEEQILQKVKEVETTWKSDKSMMKQKDPSLGGQPGADAHVQPTVAEPVAKEATTVEDWTAKQQRQLENGLRDLKDYKEKDKFVKISAMVEGKSAKQCFERFKYLCTLAKKGK